jgi:hypothetical protein
MEARAFGGLSPFFKGGKHHGYITSTSDGLGINDDISQWYDSKPVKIGWSVSEGLWLGKYPRAK